MLKPGTILDNKYQIEAAIGQGGFGYVYRARERLTGEAVAIKELVPAFVDHPEMAKRFIQEARATLRLSHPHIVRTHGIFEDRGTYYLAMEYLARGSLADALKHGPPPTREAIRIAAELCEALAYAHREGVIHCDIKPANVLFDEKGRARLADFGIAHVSAEMMTRQLFTATGTAMGTVRYMAPEQLEGVRNDPRLDIYALGTLLYEMLAGRPYLDFETESTPAAHMRNMQRIQTEQPRSLRSINPDVPPWLAAAVEKTLRKASEKRFSGARELLAALEKKEQLPPKLASDKPEGVGLEPESLPESELAEQDGALELATDSEPPVKTAPQQDEFLEPSKRAQANGFEDVPLPPILPSDEDDEGAGPGLKAIPVWGWALGGLAALVLLVGGIIWLQGRTGVAPATQVSMSTATATASVSSEIEGTPFPASPVPTSTPRESGEATATPRLGLNLLEPRDGASLTADQQVNFEWRLHGGLPELFDFVVRTDRTGFEELCRIGQQSCSWSLDPGVYEWWVEIWRGGNLIRESERRTLEVRSEGIGTTQLRPSDDMVMIYIPADEFLMGSTDDEVDAALQLCTQQRDDCKREWFEREQPVRMVALDGFWIDRTEVTNAQYALCVADGDCQESEHADDSRFNGADYPVVGVDWHNAAAYCEWAGARLPTEAEWEYAARGPERRVFPWGDTFDGTRLNFCDANCERATKVSEYDDGHIYTAPVGSYPDGASWCGGLDMAGNVWEWVADRYGPYPSGRQVNPTGPGSGEYRVLRGGSWYDSPSGTRGASRYWSAPDYTGLDVGFRCARGSQ